jgi:hypothetical protein
VSAQLNKKDVFVLAKIADEISAISMWTSAVVSLLLMLLPSILNQFTSGEILVQKLRSTGDFLLCLLSLCYTVTSVLGSHLLFKCNSERRKAFIDNAFGTKLATDKIDGYFTNDNIPAGAMKMSINTFENAFFTYSISHKMQAPLWIKSIVIAVLILAAIVFADKLLVVTVIQMALPVWVISKAIKHSIFTSRCFVIYENFRSLFQIHALGASNFDSIFPLALKNTLEYESLLAWGEMILDSNIYNEMNAGLSVKWEEIKRELSV